MKIRTKELITKYYLNGTLHKEGLFVGGFPLTPENWKVEVGTFYSRNVVKLTYLGTGRYDVSSFLRILTDVRDLVRVARENDYDVNLVAGPVFMSMWEARSFKHTPKEEIREVLKKLGVG